MSETREAAAARIEKMLPGIEKGSYVTALQDAYAGGYDEDDFLSAARAFAADLCALLPPEGEREGDPIPMVMFCPACGLQHIDAPDIEVGQRGDRWETAWNNPPHRSHLCHGCGHIWRPADVPTNGVAAIETRGKADSPIRTSVSPGEREGVAEGFVVVKRDVLEPFVQMAQKLGNWPAETKANISILNRRPENNTLRVSDFRALAAFAASPTPPLRGE